MPSVRIFRQLLTCSVLALQLVLSLELWLWSHTEAALVCEPWSVCFLAVRPLFPTHPLTCHHSSPLDISTWSNRGSTNHGQLDSKSDGCLIVRLKDHPHSHRDFTEISQIMHGSWRSQLRKCIIASPGWADTWLCCLSVSPLTQPWPAKTALSDLPLASRGSQQMATWVNTLFDSRATKEWH